MFLCIPLLLTSTVNSIQYKKLYLGEIDMQHSPLVIVHNQLTLLMVAAMMLASLTLGLATESLWIGLSLFCILAFQVLFFERMRIAIRITDAIKDSKQKP